MKTYRVFPDYCATGIWGEVGDTPYVIDHEQLFEMGASQDSIDCIRKMQFVFDQGDPITDMPKEESEYLKYLQDRIAQQLTQETGFTFRSVG